MDYLFTNYKKKTKKNNKNIKTALTSNKGWQKVKREATVTKSLVSLLECRPMSEKKMTTESNAKEVVGRCCAGKKRTSFLLQVQRPFKHIFTVSIIYCSYLKNSLQTSNMLMFTVRLKAFQEGGCQLLLKKVWCLCTYCYFFGDHLC